MKNNNKYVAHFDILGFKNAVLRNSDEAWRTLSSFQLCMEEVLHKTLKIVHYNRTISNRIHAKIFSDTVLIHSMSDEIDDLISIIVLTGHFFFGALKKCVPLRGAITHGEFFFNPYKDLYLGIPWIEAHKIGESAQWQGIIVQNEVANRFNNLPNEIFNNKKIIIKWDVIFKKNNELYTENVNVINWPIIIENFRHKIPINIKDYYEAFISLFGPYDELTDDVKNKYINTINFINQVLMEH